MLMMRTTRLTSRRTMSSRIATVSVNYQQFRIKRNLQETKKPAHPCETIARAPGSKLSFSLPPPKNVLRSSGLPQIMLEAFFNDGRGSRPHNYHRGKECQENPISENSISPQDPQLAQDISNQKQTGVLPGKDPCRGRHYALNCFVNLLLQPVYRATSARFQQVPLIFSAHSALLSNALPFFSLMRAGIFRCYD